MEHYEHITAGLKQNKGVFKALFKDITEPQQQWRPSADSWCLLEVLCHMLDEERLDFRFRAEFILKTPGKVPPPFDPANWVIDHDYMNQDYDRVLDDFLMEREHSISWLDSLKDPNWNLSFEHPKLGNMTAGYFLTNWLAHDYLHIRQINRMKYEYYRQQSGMNLNYAGNW